VDNEPDENAENIETYNAYNEAELSEFVNFDMLGDEDDNMESFNHLITNTNHVDLTGDRKVLKILLDHG